MIKPIKLSDIPNIPPVGSDYYENIFNVYEDDDTSMYYFNINRKVVFDTTGINEEYVDYIYIDAPIPLTTLSYRLFNTMHLWWLIVVMNNLNPIDVPTPGSVYIVPKKQYLSTIIQGVKSSLK